MSCKYPANLQEETHTEMWFQKKFHSTSAWVLYCKFAGDLQKTFLEEHLLGLLLCFISFVLLQVINNTFYWLAFIIYRPEFVDWSKTFLKVFFIFWYIFRNIFPNACCNWSTNYFFFSIISQTNVCWMAEAVTYKCSSRKIIWSIPVINVKRNNFKNNGQMSWGYFHFILFSFDQNLNSPKYGA